MSPTNERTSLKIDPGQLEQIILNLAVNAQDAMPGMDGRKLSKKLNDKFPQAKVLFMSGYTNDLIDLDNGDILKRFIQKPFTLENLLTRVREALGFE